MQPTFFGKLDSAIEAHFRLSVRLCTISGNLLAIFGNTASSPAKSLQYFSYDNSKAIPNKQYCDDIVTRLVDKELTSSDKWKARCNMCGSRHLTKQIWKAKEPRSQLVNANDIIDMVLDIKFNDLITIALIVDYPNNI